MSSFLTVQECQASQSCHTCEERCRGLNGDECVLAARQAQMSSCPNVRAAVPRSSSSSPIRSVILQLAELS